MSDILLIQVDYTDKVPYVQFIFKRRLFVSSSNREGGNEGKSNVKPVKLRANFRFSNMFRETNILTLKCFYYFYFFKYIVQLLK